MLHMNKQYDNKYLWHMLQNIYYFVDKETLAFAHGLFVGTVCTQHPRKYSKEELDRLLELANTIAQQRRKQVINGGI